MTTVAIVNKSTIVTDKDGLTITNALNIILPQFCKDWSLDPTRCVYIPLNSTTSIQLKIYLLDSADVEGALAYHDQYNNISYGRAFAKTVLANGGVMLYSSNPNIPTFAEAVCHELFEMLINPCCNTWSMLADGTTLYAYEVCDPVQSNPVTVQVQTGIKKTYIINRSIKITRNVPIYNLVGLSDWVLPNWFNPQSKMGPYNHNNTLKAPLTIDKNGYAIRLTGESTFDAIFGELVIPEKQQYINQKLRVSKIIR